MSRGLLAMLVRGCVDVRRAFGDVVRGFVDVERAFGDVSKGFR